MNYNDYELIYMIKEDENAFDCLLKKYEPLFKKISSSFVLRYKEKGIEYDDIWQQCLIALYFATSNYNQDNSAIFYSYLLICLKRSISNYIRNCGNKINNYNFVNIDENQNKYNIASAINIDDDYIDYEFEQEVLDFKNSLDTLDASIFELRYNGFKYKEIATLLDISVKKVDNVLVKLRKKLEKYFLFS